MMDELAPPPADPTDADWAAVLGPSMPAANFQAEALDYQPPGVGAPASSVSTVEPSADPWPPVPGDAFGPPAQLATPPAAAPVPAAIPGQMAANPAPVPAHGQLSQTVRQVTPAPGEAEAIDRARVSARDAAGADADVMRAQQAKSEADAQAKDDQSVQLRLDQQEAEDKQAALEAQEAAARAKYDKAQQDVANFKFHEYGADKSLGDRIIGKIAAALGTFNLSGNHPHNEAAEKLQREVDRDFDRQKLDLMSKENIAKWRREGVTDASAKLKEEMGALYTRQAKFHEAIAAKAAAMAIRGGMTVEEAQSNALVKKNIAAADAANAKALEAFRGSVTTTYAAAAKGKGSGGGGGGSGAAMTKFVDAVNALKPGEKVTPEIYALGHAAGFKVNQIGTEVDRIRTTGSKATASESKAEVESGYDPKAAYRENGKVVGFVPSGRGGAAAFGANMNKYSTAIRALDTLAKRAEESTGGTLPWGPELHAGVLAIAATTKANGTDRTVAHEEGTLKGPLGTVSAKAIRAKIEELKTEVAELKGQLIPPPAGKGGEGAGAYPPGTPSATNDKGEKVYFVNGKWTAP